MPIRGGKGISVEQLKDMAAAGVLGLVAIIGWFLRQKDEQQGKAIALLFQKDDEDAEALSDLKERIAREHYVKGELDARFQRLEDAVTNGLREVGVKIDKLADAMMAHFLKNEK